MKYTLENGKTVNIPDKEIEKSMKVLELTKEEAIDLWLEDNDFQENEELEELDAKAKKVKVVHGASADKPKERKPKTVKISEETIFNDLFDFLTENYNISVLKDNKLIEIKLNEKVFKLDLIETRTKKS